MKALGYFVKVFCLCAILIRKRVTQHSTHNDFFSHMLSYGLFQEFSLRGWCKKMRAGKRVRGWGMEWERRISISLLPLPLIFSRFVTLHRTSPTAQNRLALLPQAISLWVTILASFDSYIWTFLSYTGSVFFPRNQSHKRVNADGFCTLVRNSWPQSSHRYVTRYSASCQV